MTVLGCIASAIAFGVALAGRREERPVVVPVAPIPVAAVALPCASEAAPASWMPARGSAAPARPVLRLVASLGTEGAALAERPRGRVRLVVVREQPLPPG